jgi:hypothetical protein
VKRFLKILLLVLVMFILYCLFLFFVPHGSARSKLAEYKKQLIAQGEKLDLMSFVPTLPKGVSNGAPAFLSVITNWLRPNDFPSMMKMVAPGVAAIGHTNLGPIYMAGYETNKAVSRELRAIFASSSLYFDSNFSNAPNINLLPFSQVKAASSLFHYTVVQALYANDLEEAISQANAGADLVRLYCNEPLVISVLVRVACANFVIVSVWELLQHDGWTDAQLASVQTKWEQIDFFTNYDRVLAGERAYVIIEMAAARKATNAAQINPFVFWGGPQATPTFDGWLRDLFKNPKAALKDAYERYPKFWMWKSSWSYEEELCGLQLMSAGVEASRKINLLGFGAPAIAELPLQASNILNSYPNANSHFMSSFGWGGAPLFRAFIKVAQTEASRRLLITTIALKRFHLRYGKWPETLDELVPDFLEKVPIDFMDGKPLRYKFVDAKRYLLYSVGEDGKDDGGDGSPPPADGIPLPIPASGIPYRFHGMRDIVWPQPATESELMNFEERQRKATNAPAAVEAPPPANK